MAKILVIHGPNLNLLGTRENELYGKTTLSSINKELTRRGKGHKVITFQSNAEHEIIDKIQASVKDKIDCISD